MRAYFDHAATSPLSAEVLEAFTEELRALGNPSSQHAEGQAARMRLESARHRIASALGAEPAEVVLTSGGTEADNLALKGIHAARNAGDAVRQRVLVSTIEHHAILESAEHLEALGAQVVWLPVDREGRVDPDTVAREIDQDPESVSVVSVMLANNEIGTIQPIAQIAALARAHGIPVHTDAVQALGQVPIDFASLGVDALTVTAHKVGGPVGVGALVLARTLAPTPLLHGGGQERSVRSGTLDTAGATAFATAIEQAVTRLTDGTIDRMAGLRDRLADGIRTRIPDAILTGAGWVGTEAITTATPRIDSDAPTAAESTGPAKPLGPAEPAPPARLPNNVHAVFPGCEGATLLFLLDAAGFATSTGSACQAGVARPSHVLLACGFDEEQARSAQRFTLGPETTEAQVDALLEALPDAVERARRAGAVRTTAHTTGGAR